MAKKDIVSPHMSPETLDSEPSHFCREEVDNNSGCRNDRLDKLVSNNSDIAEKSQTIRKHFDCLTAIELPQNDIKSIIVDNDIIRNEKSIINIPIKCKSQLTNEVVIKRSIKDSKSTERKMEQYIGRLYIDKRKVGSIEESKKMQINREEMRMKPKNVQFARNAPTGEELAAIGLLRLSRDLEKLTGRNK